MRSVPFLHSPNFVRQSKTAKWSQSIDMYSVYNIMITVTEERCNRNSDCVWDSDLEKTKTA